MGGEANHFPTPSVGDGLLLAPSTDQVYAFSGSAGLPGPPVAGAARAGELVVLDGRIRRRHLQLRQRGLLRLGGQPAR